MGRGGSVTIPPSEVGFHPLSNMDPAGRLFLWNGRLFRAISVAAAPFYRRVLENGTIDRLVSKGLLVDSRLTPYQLADYPLVIEHKRISEQTYVFEWCFEALRDGAFMLLELDGELRSDGLALKDAHPWNILFDEGRPKLIDLGSIIDPTNAQQPEACDQLQRFFLNPLRLLAGGEGRTARTLLRDWRNGVPTRVVSRLTDGAPGVPSRSSSLRRRLGAFAESDGEVEADSLREVGRKLEALKAPTSASEWLDYQSWWPSAGDEAAWPVKLRVVDRIIRELRPQSMLDIGANRGWFSRLAAKSGCRVVAFDRDEDCMNDLDRHVRGTQEPIAPVVMAFENPSPALGVSESIPPAATRFQADLVLAVAVVHHLIFETPLTIEQVVAGLAQFCRRWLLVEFVPEHDVFFRRWWPRGNGFYSLEAFKAGLSRSFRKTTELPSSPASRVLLLCER